MRPLCALAIGLLCYAGIALAADKDPIDRALDKCLAVEKNQTTVGMAECTDIAIKAWDGRLNAAYKEAMRTLDPKSADALRTAQRQWLAFREAEHKAWQAPWQADRGTMVRLEILSAEFGAIKERTEELQLYVSRP